VDEQKRRWERKTFQRRKADMRHSNGAVQLLAEEQCMHEWRNAGTDSESGSEVLRCKKCGQETTVYFD
jgi:hypothetical protein